MENLSKTTFLILTSIVFILIAAALPSWSEEQSGSSNSSALEYKGAVLAHIHRIGNGYGSPPSKIMHSHLKNVGYDTVQLNTFAYMRDRRETDVITDGDPTMADKYLEAEIRNLRQAGFKVMLKPHIWIGGHNLDSGNWRNKIDYEDPGKRQKWFSSYEKFILGQAELAGRTGVEMLVVGTELVGVSKYTQEWTRLIRKIREIYDGKLTYAAEGMNAKNIKFWDSLDYIGIDAYFPLTDKSGPSLDELVRGWKKYQPEMKKLFDKYNKRIIFTEIGFKSVEGTAIKPWEWSKNGSVSEREQALAFEATSLAFKNKAYLAGVFVWKYFTDMNSYEKGNIPKGFTPYGKKAEEVISRWFGSGE